MITLTRDIMRGLRDAIESFALPGLDASNIVGQWIDRTYTDSDPLPRCVICPDPNPPDPPERNLSKLTRYFNYGIIFAEKVSEDKPRREGGTPMDWRDTAMERFLKGALLPTVPEVDLITILSGVPINNGAFDQAGLIWSSFNIKVRHRANLK
jgi:hypothetical protein